MYVAYWKARNTDSALFDPSPFKQKDYFIDFLSLCKNCPNTKFFCGPYFPVFGLNTNIYSVNLQI